MKLIRQASKQAYGKDNASKINSIDNMFLTKSEVSEHETIKRVLSFPVGPSNKDVLHIKNDKTREC